jgi:integrase
MAETNPEMELRLIAERDRFCSAMFSANTHKAYAEAWKCFGGWCQEAGRCVLPASVETVVLWVTSMLSAGLKVSTVDLRITGISHYHKEAGFPPPLGPEVRRVVNGARRLRHETPSQKRPLTVEQLWKISRIMDESARGVRDRALMVLGFAGAFRRSELSLLNVGDVAWTPKGLLVHLRWSKTDQDGRGRDVGVFRGDRADTCPVRTLQAWLARRGGQPGPLFVAVTQADTVTARRMSTESVAMRIKRAVRSIGLDAHLYAGHSLRSGYCTAAAENGATEISIMQRTGHKTVEMVHRYVRPVTAFSVNPLAGLL